MVMNYDPLPPAPAPEEDDEELRRLREMLAAQAAQPAAARSPAPGPAPDFSGWQPMDTMGRVVPIPGNPRAFSALNEVGMAETQGMADDFSRALQVYNNTPRDERFFVPETFPQPVPFAAGQNRAPLPGEMVGPDGSLVPIRPDIEQGPYGLGPFPPLKTPEDSDALAQDIGRRVMNTTLMALGQSPRTEDGQQYPQVNQVMSAEEERELAARQGQGAVGQTEPDAEGRTYPVVPNQLQLVEVSPGNFMIYDPESGDWIPYSRSKRR